MTLIIVGYLPVLPVLDHFPPDSVLLVDEPDVIRKRGVAAAMAGAPMLRELIGWEYTSPASADEFYNTHPDLAPTMVVPLLEYATPFAARLAERYGLPGAGSAAAAILRDKSQLRRVTRAAGIANPPSRGVDCPDDVRAFMAEFPGPVVLKPANRQASVGTKVLHDATEVDQAWAECVAQDEGALVPDRRMPLHMLVEGYLRGPEYSVELLVREGETLFANVTAKTLFPGPRPVELGHTVPADIPDALAARMRDRTEAVLRAVGFASGVVHCEWIVVEGEPHLVECAGRFPGDGIAELIERAYPVNLAAAYYAVMRGERPDPLPTRARHGATVRFLRLAPGEVTTIEGVDEAAAIPGVVRATLTVTEGDEVRELRSSWDRAGSVMAVAETPGAAEKTAELAIERIRVEVLSTRPVTIPGRIHR
ncbi:ATP-grasp domain-containing protein [Actinokineospora fastidiosa]|uniref:Argininosuccinate lyase n=1 Tax=Actinokineospora fastidiosa TaxID=1816 RepID=A0A918GH42_9PSEU|nr:ATP-grasp domain-containing protein [Actinokineospora fastidiosa]GGS35393.1 argininosuccinate lyase [Actinokineospora fastidiosa]